MRTHAFTITLVMQFCPAAFMGVTEPLEGLKRGMGGAIHYAGNYGYTQSYLHNEL